MFNLGSRAFFAIAALMGGVGLVFQFGSADRLATTLLLLGAVVSVFIGLTAVAAIGPGDRASALVGIQSPLAGRAPQGSLAPMLLAGGAAVAGIGMVLGPVAYTLGAVVALMGAIAWFITAWREHPVYVATSTPRMSDRFAAPIGMPVLVLLLVGFIVVCVSRILLAVSKEASVVVAGVAAVVILIGGVAMAAKPKLDQRLLGVLAALSVVALVVVGLVGQTKGERKFGEGKGKAAVEKKVAGAGTIAVEVGSEPPTGQAGAAVTTPAPVDETGKPAQSEAAATPAKTVPVGVSTTPETVPGASSGTGH